MKRSPAALVVALALVAAACGDSDEPAAATDTTSTTPAVDAPERIVSMSATATEMLFAIGAGDQVVAVDDNSNYPDEAPITDLSAYEPNVEAISTYGPDLVVLSGPDPELAGGLETLGIEVFVAPAATTLDDTYAQLTELGELTGHGEEAASVVEGMQADIEAIVADTSKLDEPLTYYHELDSTLFTVTSATFLGELYSLAGLENIADAADPDGANGGYPQLSAEYLVEADPDLIFLGDTKCCAQTVETFAGRPGFAGLSAVANDRVILLDDDVASRWGPRVVELLEEIVAAVEAAQSAEDRAAA